MRYSRRPTTDTVLDQTMQVRELLNGAVKATYLVGPRGPEYRRDDQAGTIRWYVYDGLGSVVGEVAPDGTLTRAQTFDVYGAVRTSNGTATTKHKFVGSLGHPSDDETGLIYMRARHYDSVTGRFLSEDPARDGANWFAYAGASPASSVDFTGKATYADLVGGLIDEINAKIMELMESKLIQSWAMNKITLALADWATKYSIDYMAGISVDVGEQKNDILVYGVDWSFAIMLHVSPDVAQPEGYPHLQLSLQGQGNVERLRLDLR